ncbi:MAG: hypothetical protein K0R54_3200 [Clostridiaceae bacterium]|jgi:hypothetical protein|nr:hypothetical protein [Clostridiaceae bacterium]
MKFIHQFSALGKWSDMEVIAISEFTKEENLNIMKIICLGYSLTFGCGAKRKEVWKELCLMK